MHRKAVGLAPRCGIGRIPVRCCYFYLAIWETFAREEPGLRFWGKARECGASACGWPKDETTTMIVEMINRLSCTILC